MPATPAEPSATPAAERILDVDVADEMQSSFLEYAYSVIYSRALPDARDGLKPVQRRILYQMAEMGLGPTRGHVKSARVVGEVMGKLHPHGDSPIYDALVRMAQDWIMRVPLVDGHGNFGSPDDGPAAPRYTEARLTAAAMAMTEGLDEDVVDFVPNYDEQLMQPAVLAAAIPNLLVNGASGIAVGMATNMPPHNLIEVIAAARHLLDTPDAALDELMALVPGPDLPGGGTIVGLAGVRDAYATGRGSFRTRARVSVEQITARRSGLVVTELPYAVGPERVIEKIKEGVQARRIDGISDVKNLTDRKRGLRLVIEIKTGFNPQAVLEQLYRLTPLEDSFGINNVALVDGAPKLLGLRELLRVFLDHRIDVVTRRSRHRLGRRRDRLHLVEGLLIAVLDIDEVIQVIRTSDDSAAAKDRLMSVFDLSDPQAEHILELRLRRLTRFSRLELEQERDALQREIDELEAILADPARLRAVVGDELQTVADRFGTPRRTLLTEQSGAPAKGAAAKTSASLEIADTGCAVLLSATGRLVRIDDVDGAPAPVAAARRRGTHDAIRSIARTTVRGELVALTSLGRALRFSPVDVPAVPASSVQLRAGVRVEDYLALPKGGAAPERVIAIVDPADVRPLAIGTRQGVVKRLAARELDGRPVAEVIALKPGDAVVGAACAADDDELVFVSDDAQLLHFGADQVRPQGRAAGGMAGIRLATGAAVLSFGAVDAASATDAVVVTVSRSEGGLAGADPGRAKTSAFSEFPAKGRATGGVRAQTMLKGEAGLAVAWVGATPALANGADGSIRELPNELVRRDASGAPLDGVVDVVGTGRIDTGRLDSGPDDGAPAAPTQAAE